MKKVNFFRLSVFAFAVAARAATLEGLPGELFVPSARPLGHLALHVSASAYGHEDESMVRDNLFLKQLYSGPLDSNQVQDMQSAALRLNFALGLGNHFDIGISIPYYGDFITDTEAKELSGSGLGDPLLSLLAGHSLAGNHILDGAVLAGLTFPSKNGKGFLPKSFAEMPDDSITALPRFFSTYGFGWSARLLLTLDLSRIEPTPVPFRASVGAGFANSGLPGARERFLLGGDLEWVALPYISFLAGAQTETRMAELKGLDAIGKEYAYAFGGFSAHGDDGIFFSVNVQKSLPANRPFREYAVPANGGVYAFAARYQPSYAIAANIGWSGGFVAEDADHDGIPDKEDNCPNEPEDKDGFQDADGCPDPDNDQDGIPDALDKCPNDPEDMDGFQDADGCPDPDNDGDGICDPWVAEKGQQAKYANVCHSSDKCPNEPEDKDGFEDEDGCPDLDNDKDGIPDAVDKCPNQPEDKDGFEDADGCPDPDNDKDGIPDVNDKCPNQPETFNGFEDADGCPDVVPGQPSGSAPLEKRTLLKSVHFLGNTAQLLPESYASLDSLAGRIRAVPGMMVEVRGYWDGAASELDGMRASEARANAVRKYLVSKGISPDQVLARGLGSREPIDNNRTAAGRQRNRRVELVRLN